jgi:uncharacterized protein
MSTLEDRLTDDYKAAMKAGDAQRRDILRSLRAAVKSATIEKREPLTEDEALAVITRQAKQRRESIEQFALGGRDDLVQKETADLLVIESYLPQQMGRDEIEELARAVISEVGATSAREIGQVMKALMPRTQGRADGKLVNEVVRSLLNT